MTYHRSGRKVFPEQTDTQGRVIDVETFAADGRREAMVLLSVVGGPGGGYVIGELSVDAARTLGLRLKSAARRLEEPATPVAGLVDAGAGWIDALDRAAAAQRNVVRLLEVAAAVVGFVAGYAAVRWVTR